MAAAESPPPLRRERVSHKSTFGKGRKSDITGDGPGREDVELGEAWLDPETIHRYAKSVELLDQFLEDHGIALDWLMDQHPRPMCTAIRCWIRFVFREDLPRYVAESGLLGLARKFFWAKGFLRPA